MSAITNALHSADESYLVGMSNKGLYKRAVKDLESADGTVTPDGETLVVAIGGETVILRDPLWESTCSCPSRSICRHVLTAILFAQSHLGEDTEDTAEEEPDIAAEETPPPPQETEPITVEDVPAPAPPDDDVMQNVRDGSALCAELLSRGLVRMPENLADHLEAAAVRAHTQKMAIAERNFRELAGLLGDLRERRAIFRTEAFLQRLTGLFAHLDGIRSGMVTELGDFKRTYEKHPGDLKLLGLGEREVTGGEYEGKVYYFLNLDPEASQTFYSWSDLRPVFYDSVTPRKRSTAPWNAAVPMAKLMESKLTLVNAKVCGGKLSSSQETEIAVRTKGDLNCDELRRHIHTDFRELAVWLSGRDRTEDTERLCLVCPLVCKASRFDAHAQELRMTMEDAASNHADLRVGYRRETKTFIEELERIGRIMLEKPDANYVWLCLADFTDGELVLSPLEVYNFITVDRGTPYRLPPQLEARENRKAPEILAFLDDVEDWLCELLQCGLRAAPDRRGHALARQAERCGMYGLSSLLTALADKAEGFRHAMHADPQDALRDMTRITRYLMLGRQKLALISALNTMQS